MSFDAPPQAALPAPPAAPAPPPMFGQQPMQKKPKPKSMQPTFLGEGANPTNTGQKTLMGQ